MFVITDDGPKLPWELDEVGSGSSSTPPRVPATKGYSGSSKTLGCSCGCVCVSVYLCCGCLFYTGTHLQDLPVGSVERDARTPECLISFVDRATERVQVAESPRTPLHLGLRPWEAGEDDPGRADAAESAEGSEARK